MVIKRLSCAFRLTDAGTGRALGGSEARFSSDGGSLRCEYKPGGYFVLNDLPEGAHRLTVTAPGYQPERLTVNVDYTRADALERVVYLPLNPSRSHPAAGRMPSICGAASGFDTLYVIGSAGKLRVAEEKAAAGSSEIRMFSEPGAPPLPADFLIGGVGGKTAELARLTGNRDGLCSTQSPLKYAHLRSETAEPLVRLRCDEDGGFFLLLAGNFRPDKQTGRYTLTFVAEKNGKIVTSSVHAALKGCTDAGKLKFTGGK